jgi:uncharacterized membrane protein
MTKPLFPVFSAVLLFAFTSCQSPAKYSLTVVPRIEKIEVQPSIPSSGSFFETLPFSQDSKRIDVGRPFTLYLERPTAIFGISDSGYMAGHSSYGELGYQGTVFGLELTKWELAHSQGYPGAGWSMMTHINESGQAIGRFSEPVENGPHYPQTVIWDGQEASFIANAWPGGVDDQGRFFYTMITDNVRNGFMLVNGIHENLGAFSANIVDVNSSGSVLLSDGTIWSQGTFTSTEQDCRASSINDNGVIVGSFISDKKPFIHDSLSGETIMLPLPAGAVSATPVSINNSNSVVGFVYSDSAPWSASPGLWVSGSQYHDLRSLVSDSISGTTIELLNVRSINNLNVIAGICQRNGVVYGCVLKPQK